MHIRLNMQLQCGLKEHKEIEGDEEDKVWTEWLGIPISKGRMLPERNFTPLTFMRDVKVLLSKNEIFEITDYRLFNPKYNPNGVHFEK